METIKKHYDLLIDENNDPVNDTPQMKKYMDKWDGEIFINNLMLDKSKSVLEIGVGTGRIALKVIYLCKKFVGIDISKKTIDRAKQHLFNYNPQLICADFINYKFNEKFDIIYSSLTFLHIKEKAMAINKIYNLLKNNGRFVLSIDKNQQRVIDFGNRKIEVYPDNKNNIELLLNNAGFVDINIIEIEFAHIFVAKKII